MIGSIAGVAGVVVALAAWLLPKATSPPTTPNSPSDTSKPPSSPALTLEVGSPGHWFAEAMTSPNAVVQFDIGYVNKSDHTQDDVVLHVDLPTGMTFLRQTTRLKNSTNPNGLQISDNLPDVGVNIGNYDPGAGAYTIFSASIDESDSFACGTRTLVPHVTMRIDDQSTGAEAFVHVTKRCP